MAAYAVWSEYENTLKIFLTEGAESACKLWRDFYTDILNDAQHVKLFVERADVVKIYAVSVDFFGSPCETYETLPCISDGHLEYDASAVNGGYIYGRTGAEAIKKVSEILAGAGMDSKHYGYTAKEIGFTYRNHAYILDKVQENRIFD